MTKHETRLVYILKDSLKDEPIYVGSGIDEKRPQEHINIALGNQTFRYNPEQQELYDRIISILDSGGEVLIDIVKRDLPLNEALELEENLTRSIGTRFCNNGPLYNIKYGTKFPEGFREGEKNSFYNKKHSKESLDKMSKPRSHTWNLSEETKRKQSEAAIRRSQSKDYIQKLRDNNSQNVGVKLYDSDMCLVREFKSLASCKRYLQETYPNANFSRRRVESHSLSGEILEGFYIIRVTK